MRLNGGVLAGLIKQLKKVESEWIRVELGMAKELKYE
jgi:hypothetical protein